jgi:hypothetical protein
MENRTLIENMLERRKQMILSEIDKQDAKGLEKYNIGIDEVEGLDWKQYAFEETIDCIQYLFKWIKEHDKAMYMLAREKDGVYHERNRLVALVSALFPASLERHPEDDKEWENDWRWIVFIDLPTGQASWHINDKELPLFDHLPRVEGRVWDNHSTEEKYERIEKLTRKKALEKL